MNERSLEQALSLPRGCQWSRLARGDHKRDIPRDVKIEIHALHRGNNNWHGLAYLGLDWLIIALTVAATLWSGMNMIIYVLAVLVIGSRQRALRSLVHEASHYKLLRNRRANTWFGRLFAAFPLLEGLSGYLCAHCAHHRYLWDQKRDPKRCQYEALGLIRPRDPVRFRRRHIIRPILLIHAPYNIISALSWRDEERRETIARFIFLGLAVLVTVVMGWTATVVALWLVPYCTTYQVFRYWSDIADHAGLESEDTWQSTRSWSASWLVRAMLAPHNANWHLSHHLFPAVPQYRTGEMDRLLRKVPEYRGGHHCEGFFRPRRADRPSVIQDVLRPEDMDGYHSGALTNLGYRTTTHIVIGKFRELIRRNSSTSLDRCPLDANGLCRLQRPQQDG